MSQPKNGEIETSLAPCPFCHEDEPERGPLYKHERQGEYCACRVVCGNEECDAQGPLAESMDDAAHEWNRALRKNQTIPRIVAVKRCNLPHTPGMMCGGEHSGGGVCCSNPAPDGDPCLHLRECHSLTPASKGLRGERSDDPTRRGEVGG